MSKNIIGIDLGTTMSVIARIDSASNSGDVRVIENKDTGNKTTPSCISFSSGEIDQIGEYAKTHIPSEEVAQLFKREMGDKNYSFTGGGASHSAIELSSEILKHLTSFASDEVGTITDVVISVPARFDNTGRDATKEAGKKAGLNVIDVINEPTAAGLAFAKQHNINGTVLVYDLGGGTFDTTILKINGLEVSEIRNDGDPNLGGADFDEVMLEIMREKYASIGNEKLYSCNNEKYKQLLKAENYKKILSGKESEDIQLYSEKGSVEATITRQEFEERTHDKIFKTEEIIRRLLAEEGEKKLEPSDIDTILLVGGGTRMPMVKKLIKKIFGENANISTGVNADTAIAEGAALHAAYKVIESKGNVPVGIKELVVNRVSNHSYGMLVSDKNGKLFNAVIIEKDKDIPCTVSNEDIYTRHDNQKVVNIRITQGTDNSKDPESNSIKIVSEFAFHLTDTDRPKGQPLKATYSYDGGESIHCVLEEVNTGHTFEKTNILK